MLQHVMRKKGDKKKKEKKVAAGVEGSWLIYMLNSVTVCKVNVEKLSHLHILNL